MTEESKGRVEPWMRRFADELTDVVDRVSKSMNGPRFCFEEFTGEILAVLSKHVPQQASAPTATEGICSACGVKYPVWSAPNPVWNRLMKYAGEVGFLCPNCFVIRDVDAIWDIRPTWFQPPEFCNCDAPRQSWNPAEPCLQCGGRLRGTSSTGLERGVSTSKVAGSSPASPASAPKDAALPSSTTEVEAPAPTPSISVAQILEIADKYKAQREAKAITADLQGKGLATEEQLRMLAISETTLRQLARLAAQGKDGVQCLP